MRLEYRLGGFLVTMAACASAVAHQRPPPAVDPGAAQPPAAAAAVTVVQKVCLPLIDGGPLADVAKGAGMKFTHGAWVLRIDHRRRIELTPPDPANPNVCQVTITHALGAGPAIERAIGAWASGATPRLTPVKVDRKSTGPSYERVTSTWEGTGPKGAIGVALSEEKTLQGRPVDRDLDQASLLVSLTPNPA